MSLISNRIEELVRKISQGNNSDFARLIGTSEANVRNYIAGTQPKFEVLAAMVDALEINCEWLLTGRGEMFDKNCIDQTKISPMDYIMVPMVDISVAAGAGHHNHSHIETEDFLPMPPSMIHTGGTYYCVKVSGLSMMPTMQDGGYVVVRALDRSEWATLKDKYVYVISDREGKAYLKRIKNRLRERGVLVMTSDNPDKNMFPNFEIPEEDIHSVLRVEWYFSRKIPNVHEQYYNKIDLLEDAIDSMRGQIGQILKRLTP